MIRLSVHGRLQERCFNGLKQYKGNNYLSVFANYKAKNVSGFSSFFHPPFLISRLCKFCIDFQSVEFIGCFADNDSRVAILVRTSVYADCL